MEIIGSVLQTHERIFSDLYSGSISLEVRKEMEYIRDYIRMNYMNSLTIEHLSKLACMSRSKFIYSFKRCFDMKVADYVKKIRIKNSKDLLINTDESITNIALSVGYNHHSSYTNAFKQSEMITPKEFRNKVKSNKY